MNWLNLLTLAEVGQGGILVEPGLHFVHDTEVAVPGLAGWRRERMPVIPPGHRFEVVPDWICEILSPATESKDRGIKIPLYAQYGVAYLWLIDPDRRLLEAYVLEEGQWRLQGEFRDQSSVAVAPFEAVTLAICGCDVFDYLSGA